MIFFASFPFSLSCIAHVIDIAGKQIRRNQTAHRLRPVCETYVPGVTFRRKCLEESMDGPSLMGTFHPVE